jgi:flagellar biosynthesis/type III secretory pathway protein FliH
MGRVIKRQETGLKRLPDEPDLQDVGAQRVISSDRFEAKSDARDIVARAEESAHSIQDQARAQADSIVAQAKKEAEKLKAQARAEGYESGRQEGVKSLSEAIAKSARRSQEFEAELVPQLRALALAIARKILGRELAQHPEGVVDIIKQALGDKARQRREIFLRLHPEDLARVRQEKAALVEVLSRCKDLALREDPDVSRYGVIIETEAGIIDAQLETQLDVFERVLKDTL